MGAMSRWKHQTGELSEYIEHFRQITVSYFSGLFHCYWLEGLPRTNNNLEQMFGSFRHPSFFFLDMIFSMNKKYSSARKTYSLTANHPDFSISPLQLALKYVVLLCTNNRYIA